MPLTKPTASGRDAAQRNEAEHGAVEQEAHRGVAIRQAAQNKLPTRTAFLIFWAKAALLKARRAVQDGASGIERFACVPMQMEPEQGWQMVGQSRTLLYAQADATEWALQRGKAQNLRRALTRLNGMTLPADKTFSFWKQVGRATKRRGYVAGRQLQEGCLFPAIGGGLCQLSNALYDAALQADCEIVERHPHTRIVAGSAAEQGRDATVAWNYIDLRFRAARPLYLHAVLTSDALIVRLYANSDDAPPIDPLPANSPAASSRFIDAPFDTPLPAAPAPPSTSVIPLAALSDGRRALNPRDHSCVSCGVSDCFRHDAPDVRALRTQAIIGASLGRQAFMVDEMMPEFAAYVQAQREETSVLFVPMDGTQLNQARYAWPLDGVGRVHTAPLPTLRRAITARRLMSADAAVRRQAQLDGAERLAAHYARQLPWDASHVVVAQSLLPFLWRNGHLGGRTFDVLMSGLPLDALHARLDAAYNAHPKRALLHDFRADAALVRSEREALNAAHRILTPHADIAALFPRQAVKLDWQMPSSRPAFSHALTPSPLPRTIAFPGPTHARKGAYELRDAARALQIEVVLAGGELEGAGFWQGVTTRRTASGTQEGADWLNGVYIVVQPAVVEDRPRRLLEALSRGIPVIATPACGLGDLPGVVTIPAGNTNALQEAIQHCLHLS